MGPGFHRIKEKVQPPLPERQRAGSEATAPSCNPDIRGTDFAAVVINGRSAFCVAAVSLIRTFAASANATATPGPERARCRLVAVQRACRYRADLNVGSHLPRPFILSSQQMTALRRFCGKTSVCERRILALVTGAGALLVRRFAVSAVREGSSPVSGGSGRWQRAGIRRSHRTGRGVGAVPVRGYA